MRLSSEQESIGTAPSQSRLNKTPTPSAPTSSAPASSAPAPNAPTANAPAPNAPTASAPAPKTPAPSAPAASAPAANAPTSNAPTASAPTANAPAPSAPAPNAPTANAPTPSAPTASAPAANAPAASAPTPQSRDRKGALPTRLLAAALLLATLSPAQQPKPLRERLLERAQQGDAEAQYDLAKNLETGRIGLRRDMIQAEHWYRMAAEQGDPFAQAGLAILYQFGKGVKADPVESCMWYTLAAAGTKGGDHESIADMLRDIEEKMTPEQKAGAKKRAAQWKPKK